MPAEITTWISKVSLITVCGPKQIRRDDALACIKSWNKIQGVHGSFRLIPDGLEPEGIENAQSLGFQVHDRHPEQVRQALEDKPFLATIRDRLPTWRHVIDSLILCRDSEYILLIDTDVFIVEPIAFQGADLDFVYNVDDIPGFRGKWYLPFREPMVPAINPGFMLLRPKAIDLKWLDTLVERYFINSRNYWWTRQSALSVVVGRSSLRGAFDGRDVRVFSGNCKRTPQQIRTNYWKYFGSNRLVDDAAYAEQFVDGAAVVHFSGKGKRWIHLAQARERTHGDARLLSATPAQNATGFQRLMIALRMLARIRH